MDQIAQFLDELTEDLADPTLVYPLANTTRVERMNMQRRFLSKKLQEARAVAEQPQVDRSVAIRVLYCTKLPRVILDTKVGDPVQVVEPGAPGGHLRPDPGAQPKLPMVSKTAETAYLVSAQA